MAHSTQVLHIIQGTFYCVAKYLFHSACAVAPLHFERKLGHRAAVLRFGYFNYTDFLLK